jgi:hypothetical protein
MSDEGSLRTALSKPRPFLGPPRVLAPRKEGHVSATVQFIVPGLVVSAAERERLVGLFDRLDVAVEAAAIERAANEATGQSGILVSATFYVLAKSADEAEAVIDTASALLVERFLGVLSFLAGVRCVAINAQTTRTGEGASYSTTLEPSSRAGQAPATLKWDEGSLGHGTPPPQVFNAFLWLRRGLAARDPLATYGALMNSLEATAGLLVDAGATRGACPQCGRAGAREAVDTDILRELVVGRIGASPELFDRIWDARGAALARGGASVTADTLRRLTELKFEAATLCYKGIKLALGLPLDGPPQLDPALFITSTLMDVH